MVLVTLFYSTRETAITVTLTNGDTVRINPNQYVYMAGYKDILDQSAGELYYGEPYMPDLQTGIYQWHAAISADDWEFISASSFAVKEETTEGEFFYVSEDLLSANNIPGLSFVGMYGKISYPTHELYSGLRAHIAQQENLQLYGAIGNPYINLYASVTYEGIHSSNVITGHIVIPKQHTKEISAATQSSVMGSAVLRSASSFAKTTISALRGQVAKQSVAIGPQMNAYADYLVKIGIPLRGYYKSRELFGYLNGAVSYYHTMQAAVYNVAATHNAIWLSIGKRSITQKGIRWLVTQQSSLAQNLQGAITPIKTLRLSGINSEIHAVRNTTSKMYAGASSVAELHTALLKSYLYKLHENSISLHVAISKPKTITLGIGANIYATHTLVNSVDAAMLTTRTAPELGIHAVSAVPVEIRANFYSYLYRIVNKQGPSVSGSTSRPQLTIRWMFGDVLTTRTMSNEFWGSSLYRTTKASLTGVSGAISEPIVSLYNIIGRIYRRVPTIRYISGASGLVKSTTLSLSADMLVTKTLRQQTIMADMIGTKSSFANLVNSYVFSEWLGQGSLWGFINRVRGLSVVISSAISSLQESSEIISGSLYTVGSTNTDINSSLYSIGMANRRYFAALSVMKELSSEIRSSVWNQADTQAHITGALSVIHTNPIEIIAKAIALANTETDIRSHVYRVVANNSYYHSAISKIRIVTEPLGSDIVGAKYSQDFVTGASSVIHTTGIQGNASIFAIAKIVRNVTGAASFPIVEHAHITAQAIIANLQTINNLQAKVFAVAEQGIQIHGAESTIKNYSKELMSSVYARAVTARNIFSAISQIHTDSVNITGPVFTQATTTNKASSYIYRRTLITESVEGAVSTVYTETMNILASVFAVAETTAQVSGEIFRRSSRTMGMWAATSVLEGPLSDGVYSWLYRVEKRMLPSQAYITHLHSETLNMGADMITTYGTGNTLTSSVFAIAKSYNTITNGDIIGTYFMPVINIQGAASVTKNTYDYLRSYMYAVFSRDISVTGAASKRRYANSLVLSASVLNTAKTNEYFGNANIFWRQHTTRPILAKVYAVAQSDHEIGSSVFNVARATRSVAADMLTTRRYTLGILGYITHVNTKKLYNTGFITKLHAISSSDTAAISRARILTQCAYASVFAISKTNANVTGAASTLKGDINRLGADIITTRYVPHYLRGAISRLDEGPSDNLNAWIYRVVTETLQGTSFVTHLHEMPHIQITSNIFRRKYLTRSMDAELYWRWLLTIGANGASSVIHRHTQDISAKVFAVANTTKNVYGRMYWRKQATRGIHADMIGAKYTASTVTGAESVLHTITSSITGAVPAIYKQVVYISAYNTILHVGINSVQAFLEPAVRMLSVYGHMYWVKSASNIVGADIIGAKKTTADYTGAASIIHTRTLDMNSEATVLHTDDTQTVTGAESALKAGPYGYIYAYVTHLDSGASYIDGAISVLQTSELTTFSGFVTVLHTNEENLSGYIYRQSERTLDYSGYITHLRDTEDGVMANMYWRFTQEAELRAYVTHLHSGMRGYLSAISSIKTRNAVVSSDIIGSRETSLAIFSFVTYMHTYENTLGSDILGVRSASVTCTGAESLLHTSTFQIQASVYAEASVAKSITGALSRAHSFSQHVDGEITYLHTGTASLGGGMFWRKQVTSTSEGFITHLRKALAGLHGDLLTTRRWTKDITGATSVIHTENQDIYSWLLGTYKVTSHITGAASVLKTNTSEIAADIIGAKSTKHYTYAYLYDEFKLSDNLQGWIYRRVSTSNSLGAATSTVSITNGDLSSASSVLKAITKYSYGYITHLMNYTSPYMNGATSVTHETDNNTNGYVFMRYFQASPEMNGAASLLHTLTVDATGAVSEIHTDTASLEGAIPFINTILVDTNSYITILHTKTSPKISGAASVLKATTMGSHAYITILHTLASGVLGAIPEILKVTAKLASYNTILHTNTATNQAYITHMTRETITIGSEATILHKGQAYIYGDTQGSKTVTQSIGGSSAVLLEAANNVSGALSTIHTETAEIGGAIPVQETFQTNLEAAASIADTYDLGGVWAYLTVLHTGVSEIGSYATILHTDNREIGSSVFTTANTEANVNAMVIAIDYMPEEVSGAYITRLHTNTEGTNAFISHLHSETTDLSAYITYMTRETMGYNGYITVMSQLTSLFGGEVSHLENLGITLANTWLIRRTPITREFGAYITTLHTATQDAESYITRLHNTSNVITGAQAVSKLTSASEGAYIYRQVQRTNNAAASVYAVAETTNNNNAFVYAVANTTEDVGSYVTNLKNISLELAGSVYAEAVSSATLSGFIVNEYGTDESGFYAYITHLRTTQNGNYCYVTNLREMTGSGYGYTTFLRNTQMPLRAAMVQAQSLTSSYTGYITTLHATVIGVTASVFAQASFIKGITGAVSVSKAVNENVGSYIYEIHSETMPYSAAISRLMTTSYEVAGSSSVLHTKTEDMAGYLYRKASETIGYTAATSVIHKHSVNMSADMITTYETTVHVSGATAVPENGSGLLTAYITTLHTMVNEPGAYITILHTGANNLRANVFAECTETLSIHGAISEIYTAANEISSYLTVMHQTLEALVSYATHLHTRTNNVGSYIFRRTAETLGYSGAAAQAKATTYFVKGYNTHLMNTANTMISAISQIHSVALSPEGFVTHLMNTTAQIGSYLFMRHISQHNILGYNTYLHTASLNAQATVWARSVSDNSLYGYLMEIMTEKESGFNGYATHLHDTSNFTYAYMTHLATETHEIGAYVTVPHTETEDLRADIIGSKGSEESLFAEVFTEASTTRDMYGHLIVAREATSTASAFVTHLVTETEPVQAYVTRLHATVEPGYGYITHLRSYSEVIYSSVYNVASTANGLYGYISYLRIAPNTLGGEVSILRTVNESVAGQITVPHVISTGIHGHMYIIRNATKDLSGSVYAIANATNGLRASVYNVGNATGSVLADIIGSKTTTHQAGAGLSLPVIENEDLFATLITSYKQTVDILGDMITTYGMTLSGIGSYVVPPVPLAMTLASPADGSTGVSTNVTLKWNSSTYATSYTVFVNGVSEGTTNGLSMTLSGLSANTVYNWYVVPSNIGGDGPASDTWSFTTICAPGAFTLTSPTNNGIADLTDIKMIYSVSTTEDLTEPEENSGIYVPIKVTESDLQSIGLSMSSLDKTRIAFNDNAGNACEFRREYWNTSLGEALFIVKLQKDGSAVSTVNTSDTIILNLTTNSTTDLSSGPETCLLAIGKGDNGNVIDVSGNSGYNASVLSWGSDSTYGDYLIFNNQRIQITNTNGSSDTRTVLMFFNHTSTDGEMLLGFYKYDVYPITEMAYNSDSNRYSTGFTTSTNTWYHLGAVMTGTGNMVGNKMYINGDNKPLSWTTGSGNGNAVFQNYITLGSWMINSSYMLHGYESQIYYFDRELSAGEIYGFYKFGNKTASYTRAVSGDVTLTWNASTYATSYEVFLNGTSQGTTTNTSMTVSGLSVGTTYSWYVVASNEAGTATSATESFTTTDQKIYKATFQFYADDNYGWSLCHYDLGNSTSSYFHQVIMGNRYSEPTLMKPGTSYGKYSPNLAFAVKTWVNLSMTVNTMTGDVKVSLNDTEIDNGTSFANTDGLPINQFSLSSSYNDYLYIKNLVITLNGTTIYSDAAQRTVYHNTYTWSW